MSVSDYIRNYIDEMFKSSYQERERQGKEYSESVEAIRFPTQVIQGIATSYWETSAAIR